ncbi:hypothetical protein [Rana grylio virus]|uniref:Uncharacterized protein n=3 Tax=Frog virus 3 TaxID=10493 RepID=A0A2P1GJN1_FRG3V|nr:unknown [Soft-shelled turtle iridovirus]AFG73142.1 hypothetical protein [Rana grylio virus]AVM86163.1 hypothetical protein [Rana nigromaculata ranavirus]
MSLLIKLSRWSARIKKMDKPTVETSAAPVETLVLTEPPAETQAEDSVSSVLAGLTAAIETVDRLRTVFGAE